MGKVFLVAYDPDSLRDLDELDRGVQREIVRTIDAKLTTNPITFGKPLRYSLKGARVLRVGDYRVVFRINGRSVLIGLISHRSLVYKQAQARFR